MIGVWDVAKSLIPDDSIDGEVMALRDTSLKVLGMHKIDFDIHKVRF